MKIYKIFDYITMFDNLFPNASENIFYNFRINIDTLVEQKNLLNKHFIPYTTHIMITVLMKKSVYVLQENTRLGFKYLHTHAHK